MTLKPRVDALGVIQGGEDYVFFGQYPHCLGPNAAGDANDYEDTNSPSPILWRVMSTDVAAEKATLLSHYLIEVNRFDGDSSDWDSSDMKKWLESEGVSETIWRWRTGETLVPGFQHTSRFTSTERGAISGMTLPSKGELDGLWFANDNHRIAYHKSKGPTGSGSIYWTRSPSDADKAWAVRDVGGLVGITVSSNTLGIRPAFFLNLESVIFKSGSSDVFASLPNGGAGSIDDPFILFLSGEDSKYSLPKFASADLSLTSADIDGTKLTLTFGANVSPAVRSWPDKGDFTLRRSGGTSMHPTTVASRDVNQLVLTFPTAVKAGEVISLDYNLNHDAVSFDVSGGVTKVMASSSDIAVLNRTKEEGGSTPPDPDTGPGTTPVPVTGVAVSQSTSLLAIGATETLAAIITPSSATNKNVTWKSSDESVATVDKNGKITAVGPGTCTITVTTASGGFSASCEVTVTGGTEPGTPVTIDFSGLNLENNILKLKPGDEVDLKISGSPSGIKFSATGLPPGLELDENGHLFGKVPDEGTYTVTVTATINGVTKSQTFIIEVKSDGTIVVTPTGGGGCAAGFGLLALLALAVATIRRRR